MTYKLLIIFLVASTCFFAMESERETMLEKIAKVHIEHNLKFNSEYERLREISTERLKKKVSSKKDDANGGQDVR